MALKLSHSMGKQRREERERRKQAGWKAVNGSWCQIDVWHTTAKAVEEEKKISYTNINILYPL